MPQIQISLLSDFPIEERNRLSKIMAEKYVHYKWLESKAVMGFLHSPKRVVFCALSGEKLVGFYTCAKENGELVSEHMWAHTPKTLIKGAQNPQTVGRRLKNRAIEHAASENLQFHQGLSNTEAGASFGLRYNLRKNDAAHLKRAAARPKRRYPLL